MGLKADLDAMTADAAAWNAAADVLGDAKSAVDTLTLSDSVFCFAGGDVAALYETARSHVETFLQTGTDETRGAATTLISVRDDFLNTDAGESNRHAGAWDPQ